MRVPVCTVCKRGVYMEHPDTTYERNPETLRRGWMHGDCARMAYTELTNDQREKYLAKD